MVFNMCTPTSPESVFSFCPRCGSRAFAPQADRSFRCGECAFHLYVNAAAAVAALIVNERGELLLTRRALEPQKGLLDLPGGFVDPGERVEEALLREIKEELNLEVDHYRFLVSYPNEYVFGGLSVYTADLAFECRVSSFEEIHWGDDISGYAFIAPEELDFSRICSESIRQIIRHWQNGRGD